MLIEDFLRKLESGVPRERAEIAASLAAVYLDAPLDEVNRGDTLAALTVICDDPAPVVRAALSKAFASSHAVPIELLRVLAADTGEVAAPVIRHSPVFSEADLVDIVGTGSDTHHLAMARRQPVGVALSAALVALAGPEACIALIENPHARLSHRSLALLVERHRANADIREALLARDDLPFDLRQELVEGLVGALSEFLVSKAWLSTHRARQTLDDAFVDGLIRMAGEGNELQMAKVAARLQARGSLDEALLLRAICMQQDDFAIAAFAIKSGLPLKRAAALYAGGGSGFRALYRKARLDQAAMRVFETAHMSALTLERDGGAVSVLRKRLMVVERALTAAGQSEESCSDLSGLLVRLSAELMRAQAREATGGYFKAA